MSEVLKDGEYQIPVSLEGGSGRAGIASPANVTVEDGNATAEIIWSSPNYDYMLVDGQKYLKVNDSGNSTFEIPVADLAQPLDVVGDTTAMSKPIEIEYTITFDVGAAERTSSAGGSILHVAIPVITVCFIAGVIIGIKASKKLRRAKQDA